MRLRFSMLTIVNDLVLKALRQSGDAQIQVRPESRAEMRDIFDYIFDLFTKADSCKSLQDILTLESDRASVLQCYRLAGRVYLRFLTNC